MIGWCDVETTGLDEKKDHLLEVAIVITNDELEEKAALSHVIKPVGIEIDDVVMPLDVVEMHEKSGLLKDVKNIGIRRHEAEASFIKWLTDLFHGVDNVKKIPLAGSTVSFDGCFLAEHMPDLKKLFSYRYIDVSCLTELSKRWSVPVYNNRPKKDAGVAHRALDDIRQSIESLRYYRTHFLKV